MDILKCISWDSPLDKLAVHIEAHKLGHKTRVLEQLSCKINNLKRQEQQVLLSSFFDLSEKSIENILIAPELYYWLTAAQAEEHSNQNFFQFLNECIIAEQYRQNKQTNPQTKQVVWSALGDIQCCLKSNSICNNFTTYTHGITIDNMSPRANRRPNGTIIQCPQKGDRYDIDNFKLVCDQALSKIREINEGTYSFVTNFLSTIVLQKDSQNKGYSTISGRSFVGRVIFRNPPDNLTPIESVIDALIHESIHSYLYIHEQRNKWMKENGANLRQV